MKRQTYLLTPSRLGEEYAVVRCVVATLSLLGIRASRRRPLVAAATRALEAMMSEPLPREIAKGISAHLFSLAKAVRDKEMRDLICCAAKRILAQAPEELRDSPFN